MLSCEFSPNGKCSFAVDERLLFFRSDGQSDPYVHHGHKDHFGFSVLFLPFLNLL
jgi:hypothetical protein